MQKKHFHIQHVYKPMAGNKRGSTEHTLLSRLSQHTCQTVFKHNTRSHPSPLTLIISLQTASCKNVAFSKNLKALHGSECAFDYITSQS